MELLHGEGLITLIKAVGYLGLFGIVFAESGLLVGFFLPGDSLLFTAGFLASQGILNIWLVLLIIFAAAVLGDNTGYAFGRKVGPRLFKRENSRLFHKDNLMKAEAFYQKYGPFTIVIARFVPIVRTFAPIVAGIGKMDYRQFLVYNIFGGLFWSVSVTMSGYILDRIFPSLKDHLEPVILIIVLISVLPAVYHYFRERAKTVRKG